jgi:hypothetical protein
MSSTADLADRFRDTLLFQAIHVPGVSTDEISESIKEHKAWHELSDQEKFVWSKAASSMIAMDRRSELANGDLPMSLTFSRDSE